MTPPPGFLQAFNLSTRSEPELTQALLSYACSHGVTGLASELKHQRALLPPSPESEADLQLIILTALELELAISSCFLRSRHAPSPFCDLLVLYQGEPPSPESLP